MSGVPQGSVLGPLMFIIFINDIDLAALNVTLMKKFADDTKLGQKIRNQEDINTLQSTLENLYNWSIDWGMQFNVEKCKVIHIGRTNPEHGYKINGKELKVVDEETDIGIIIHKSLKPSRQCMEAAKRASTVLTQLSRSFYYRDKHVFTQLYKQYVRPHLEFSVPAWSPWTESDKETLEKVQKRFINMISGLTGKTYTEKLKEVGLWSLEDRRIRYDMVETYKILHGVTKVNKTTWFTPINQQSQHLTRLSSDHLNLSAPAAKLEIRRNFYSCRIIKQWNAPTVGSFKSQFDKHYYKNQ